MKTTIYLLALSVCLFAGCKKQEHKLTGAHSKVTAHDILSSASYEELVIEIAYEGSNAPDASAVNNFLYFVTARVNKPQGVSIQYNSIPDQGKAYYTLSELDQLEAKYKKYFSTHNKLTLFVFYANADYAQNDGSFKVLGVAYGGSSFAVFGKTTKEYSNSITEPERKILEATVFNHEMGHLMGLVANGSPMVANHMDAPHGHHCNNENCLMYYEVENTGFIDNLLGTGRVPELDQACINDIRNNGGK